MVRDSFQAQKTCFKRLLCLNSSFASRPTGSTVCTAIYFQAVRQSPRPAVVSAVCFLFRWRGAGHQLKAVCLFPLSVADPSRGAKKRKMPKLASR